MLVLAAGTGTAKALGTLSIPVITRIYSPEQYGVFSLFLSVTALLTPLATLRYSAALPLPRSEKVAAGLLTTCFLLLLLFSGLLSLIFSLSDRLLPKNIPAAALYEYWPLLVLSVATAGAYEILQGWSTRTRRFKTMAAADVSQSLMGAITKIGFGLVEFKRTGLLIGHLIAQGLSCLVMMSKLPYARLFGAFRKRSFLLRYCLRRYSDFPTFRLPSQFLLVFSVQAPLFFFGTMYGTEQAGQLGLALVALAVPITLIGQSTGQAYYGEIARIGASDPKKILKVTRNVSKRLFYLGLFPSTAILLGSTFLFPIFFGPKWTEAGYYASILSIYLFLQFVSNPLGHVLSVLKRQGLFLWFNFVRAVLVASVFGTCAYLHVEPLVAALAYSTVLTLHYGFMIRGIFKVIKRHAAAASQLN